MLTPSDTRMRQRGGGKIGAEADLGIQGLHVGWDDGTRMPSKYGTEHTLILTAGDRTVRVRISIWMLGEVVIDTEEFKRLRKTLTRRLRLLKPPRAVN